VINRGKGSISTMKYAKASSRKISGLAKYKNDTLKEIDKIN
jgi:hypothetical protein